MKSFLLLAAWFFSSVSWAQINEYKPELATFEKFKASSNVIVEKLRSQGIRKVGELDLDKLAKEIEKTKWFELKGGFFSGSGKGRTTAVYLVKERKIWVSELALRNLDASVFPLASLHEVLGMWGYHDENYELTLALYQLTKDPYKTNRVFEDRFKGMAPRIRENQIYKNKDGGTSVGGGGDGVTLEIKQHVLNEAVELQVADDVMNKILNAEIEPNYDSQLARISVTKPNGKISIIFPAVQWLILTWTKNEQQKKKYASHLLQIFVEDK